MHDQYLRTYPQPPGTFDVIYPSILVLNALLCDLQEPDCLVLGPYQGTHQPSARQEPSSGMDMEQEGMAAVGMEIDILEVVSIQTAGWRQQDYIDVVAFVAAAVASAVVASVASAVASAVSSTVVANLGSIASVSDSYFGARAPSSCSYPSWYPPFSEEHQPIVRLV